jgi:hypothetical protein
MLMSQNPLDYSRRFHELKAAIEKKGRYDLDTLAKAGWDRRSVLGKLTICVIEESDMPKQIRRRQNLLKGMARRLRILAEDMRKLDKDKVFRAHFGGSLNYFGEANWFDIKKPSSKKGSARLMELVARKFDAEAAIFGKFLRKHGRIDARIVPFLALCWFEQPDPRVPTDRHFFQLRNLDEFARLLTDARECAGRPREFTAGELGRMLKRHGRSAVDQLCES